MVVTCPNGKQTSWKLTCHLSLSWHSGLHNVAFLTCGLVLNCSCNLLFFSKSLLLRLENFVTGHHGGYCPVTIAPFFFAMLKDIKELNIQYKRQASPPWPLLDPACVYAAKCQQNQKHQAFTFLFVSLCWEKGRSAESDLFNAQQKGLWWKGYEQDRKPSAGFVTARLRWLCLEPTCLQAFSAMMGYFWCFPQGFEVMD